MLTLVAGLDLHLFHAGQIEPRAMAGREVSIVMFGFVVSILVLGRAVYWLFTKQWRNAFYSILSSLSFLLCFILGGIFGAAYLNAT